MSAECKIINRGSENIQNKVVIHTSIAMWSCSQAAVLVFGSSGGDRVKFG